MDEFHKKLKIPYVTEESPTSYIKNACVYAGAPGVYAQFIVEQTCGFTAGVWRKPLSGVSGGSACAVAYTF
ncbi:MAG: hypothetical protein R3B47_03990 [Bacteroidia bacterium]